MAYESLKVYPKQFRWDKIPTQRNRVFVLMPFSDQFDGVYGAIKKALVNNNYSCARADELDGSTLVMHTILREIMKSRYVIADLTGSNPNVFYELGIAHSFKDLPNVIMIKEEGNPSPFDISHLRYIEYNRDNLFLLTSSILDMLKRGGRLSDFQEALDRNNISSVVSENRESFVDRIQEFFNFDLDDFTMLLNGDASALLGRGGYESVLAQFRSFVVQTLDSGDTGDMDGILKVYTRLISSCPESTGTEEYAQDFLTSLFAPYDLPDSLAESWRIDFATSLAKQHRQMQLVLPYLISYLRRIKTAGIDLNRYKVEKFLLLSSDEEVNEALVDAIDDDDCHVREYVSDLIGDKGLVQAREFIIAQLKEEHNVYTARSMLRALGKLGDERDIATIIGWVESHEQALRDGRANIVFRHAYLALERLSAKSNAGRDVLREFKSAYGDMIDEAAF